VIFSGISLAIVLGVPIASFVGGWLAGPTVVSALLLIFGIGGLVGNFGVVRLLSRRLKATVVGMAATLAVATAAMPVLGGWRPAVAVVLAVWDLACGAMTVAMQTWVFTADGRDLWSGSALYPAVFQASIAVGSLLGGGVVGALGDRGAIWTGTVFAALALLGFALFARPAPAGRGPAGPGIRDRRIMTRSLAQRLAPGGRDGRRGRAGAGDHVAQLVAAGDAQLGVGPVQVGADRAR
jgi:predicted MFS family arabinose efflux permease